MDETTGALARFHYMDPMSSKHPITLAKQCHSGWNAEQGVAEHVPMRLNTQSMVQDPLPSNSLCNIFSEEGREFPRTAYSRLRLMMSCTKYTYLPFPEDPSKGILKPASWIFQRLPSLELFHKQMAIITGSNRSQIKQFILISVMSS